MAGTPTRMSQMRSIIMADRRRDSPVSVEDMTKVYEDPIWMKVAKAAMLMALGGILVLILCAVLPPIQTHCDLCLRHFFFRNCFTASTRAQSAAMTWEQEHWSTDVRHEFVAC